MFLMGDTMDFRLGIHGGLWLSKMGLTQIRKDLLLVVFFPYLYNYTTKIRIRGGCVDWFKSGAWIESNEVEQSENDWRDPSYVAYALGD